MSHLEQLYELDLEAEKCSRCERMAFFEQNSGSNGKTTSRANWSIFFKRNTPPEGRRRESIENSSSSQSDRDAEGFAAPLIGLVCDDRPEFERIESSEVI
jgi:hypothetical protein